VSSYPSRQRIDSCKADLRKAVRKIMKADDLDDYLAIWIALGEFTVEHGLDGFGRQATLMLVREIESYAAGKTPGAGRDEQ